MNGITILSGIKKEEILYEGRTYTRTEQRHSEGYKTIRWTEGIEENAIYNQSLTTDLESEYQNYMYWVG